MKYKMYQYPRGANSGGYLTFDYCPTISCSSWENNCLLVEIENDDDIQDDSEGRDRDNPLLSIKDIAFTINANLLSDRQKVIEVYEGDYKV